MQQRICLLVFPVTSKPPNPSSPFSISQARGIIKDLFPHRQAIYFADLLVSITIGYLAAGEYLWGDGPLWVTVACYLIGGFALFRVGSFIHEIVHFRGKEMRAFRITWDIIAGIPMLMPSYFYLNHIDHHKIHHYGTGKDGEYLPLASGTLRNVLKFYSQVLVLPLFVFFRFALLTPISFLHPRLRQWTLECASSYVINFRYRREVSEGSVRKWWAAQEILCSLRAMGFAVSIAIGVNEPMFLPRLYGFAIFVLGLNYIRNLVAHHYRSDGESMTHEDQLHDSVNITGGYVFTELFFPLGLRYHALHHLFPALPYHNLGIAHRRLLRELSENSAYRATVYSSFWDVVGVLWSDMRQAARGGNRSADVWFRRRREILTTGESPHRSSARQVA